MFTNTQWTNGRGLRVMLAALLVGTALGAGGVAWSSSDFQTPTAPLSVAVPAQTSEMPGTSSARVVASQA